VSVLAPEIFDDLVEQARRGDDAALRVLIEGVYATVRRWALVQLGDPTDADDLTQDVLIQMIRKLDTFHGHARFESWLYSMTRNAAMDRIRRERRGRRVTDDPSAPLYLAPTTAPDPTRRVELREFDSAFECLFHDLPERQRTIFDLVELQGFTASEVGALLDIKPVSVRAHLFKARRKLRSRIMTEWPELAEGLS
jgi:RNA polymerase sigma-70 factor (ECF subfamily)